jgi:hypothetical protein
MEPTMQLRRRLESLEQIISMGEKLLTTFDIEELLDGLVKNVCKLLDAEGATLYLVDSIEGRLISQSIKSDKVKEISLIIDNSSIAGHTALSRKSLHIPDVYDDLSKIHPELKFNRKVDEESGKRTRNVITQPLILHDELIGVFQVVNKRSGEFCEDDQIILHNFGLIAGVAIMNARLMERVLEAQASNANIIDNISDMVVVQNDKGFILHLNGCASKYLEENERAGNNVGKYFSDVFPEFANLATEIAKVVEHRLDKSVSRGCPSYVILTEKNFRQEIERVILILHNINSETNPDDTMKK